MPSQGPVSAAVSALVDAGLLCGIKVETEGEGASWASIQMLNSLALACGLPLTLKIGGCDARTDLLMGNDLGVTDFVAPMIETPFAAEKFREAVEALPFDKEVTTFRILIESVTGTQNAAEIVRISQGWVSGMNVGRTDLSKSMRKSFESPPLQDSADVVRLAGEVTGIANEAGLQTTMGGRMTAKSIRSIETQLHQAQYPDRVETRRLILSWARIAGDPDLLDLAIAVERQITHWLAGKSIRESSEWARYIAELDTRMGASVEGPVFP